MTDLLENRFTFAGTIAIARLEGHMAVRHGIRWIGETLAWARHRQYRRLMIVITGATGFAAPSLALRVEMIREWAAAAGDTVSVAIVCRPELIDPEKFGITVATGFGLTANVFADEHTALDWLGGLA
jgi:hypothetical protein